VYVPLDDKNLRQDPAGQKNRNARKPPDFSNSLTEPRLRINEVDLILD
jgi:hypothetical protein